MAVGVKVETSVRSGSSQPLVAPSGQYFVVGQCERGDTSKPVSLRSMADYDRFLGGRVTYGTLFDDLKVFFEEGGSLAHVARVVGATATVGTLTLADRSASAGLSTLRIDAQNAGAWSSGATVEITDGTDANTFNVIVRYGTDVETFAGIADPAAAVLRLQASKYVRATNLGSASAPPTNNPRVLAPTPLTAGNDQRATIVTADYTAALNRFTKGMGDGVVAMPGQTAAAGYTALEAHAKANRRLCLIAGARGLDANALRAIATANPSPRLGVVGPWINVPDGSGGYRTVSPEGFAAAKRNLAAAVGPWRAPGGLIGKAQYVSGLDQEFDTDTADALDTGRVCVIRLIQGSPRLYGWRSTSTDEGNYYSLTSQDTLNRATVQGEAILEPFVFDVVDGRRQALARMAAEMAGLFEEWRAAGGLFEMVNAAGEQVDPGYSVNTGPEVNTLERLSRNEVRVECAIRPSPSASLITYSIVKVGLTASV